MTADSRESARRAALRRDLLWKGYVIGGLMLVLPVALRLWQGRWDPFEVVQLTAWSKGRLAIIGDAANALPPNLGQGGGCAMMNALSLAVIVDRMADVEAGLREWERLERPLTDHTQRISLLYGRPTTWPPRLRAWAFAFAGRNAWLLKQRLKTANHIPRGTRGNEA